MTLQALIAKTKFQTVYGQALSIRINGGFIVLDDARTGAAFDWMNRDDFEAIVADAIVEESGALTINW